MPVDPDTLSSLASEYAKDMTSIRGRRVQRLLKREFAGAEYVLLAQLASGAAAVLGLSPSGAALCATNGKGRHATVVKWSHGATAALETQFDLYKDSLPALGSSSLPIARLREQARLQVPARAIPSEAGPWVTRALQVLSTPIKERETGVQVNYRLRQR